MAAGRENFGLFLDSSPDRWGRVLLQRREAQLARAQSRKEQRLLDPVADVAGLTLNISETDNSQDLSLVRDVARAFRVGARNAEEIITEVVSVVRGWRVEAERAQLSRAEQERMAPAFRLAT